ncbi:hypothetical protein [Hymenobacter sp. HDW8]|uniref:hypothetical protein n=1 Tax=Hymenobacter sp. HDW8 TaxID=2714932 RepID=UPI00140C3CCA|nr:hypothetical protein [Hymenobacter sp. HDW8]QIL78389.1 hypothetical protein G7064_21445 [Hymenobacter sp. HDW8]
MWKSSIPEWELVGQVFAAHPGRNVKDPITAQHLTELPAFQRAVHGRMPRQVVLDTWRQRIDDVLSQDGSFYKGISTLPFTHWRHLSSDWSDQGVGKLLAHLVVEEENPGPAVALRNALCREEDPLHRLLLPLLRTPTPEQQKPGPLPQATSAEQELLARSPTLQAIVGVLRHLATAPLTGPELLSRFTTMATLGIWLHLLNGNSPQPTPLLLCAANSTDGARSGSQQALARAGSRLQKCFTAALMEELSNRGMDDLSTDAYAAWGQEIFEAPKSPKKGQAPKPPKVDQEAKARFELDFEQFTISEASLFAAACRALTPPASERIAKKKAASTPLGSVNDLGRHLGLYWPRRQGAGARSLRPTAALYDALVPSLLQDKTPVSAREFWRLATTKLGLISGEGGPEDLALLTRAGINGVTLADLKRNAHDVRDELTRLGYARTYADDVTMIATSW